MGWIVAIITGILAGWIAEKIMRRNHGLLTNLVVGLIGGVIGNFVLGLVGLGRGGANGWIFSVFAAVLGAVILLAVLGAIKSRR
jgi:uncharacterized membrane protein YeaQ/YmgE (transglycosylase-associated protein family)